MTGSAIVGVSDHGGWAVLVTVDAKGNLIDRRRVELIEPGLPRIPHHSEGKSLPIDKAVALIQKVKASAERNSLQVLGALEKELDLRIDGIALRKCPELPSTTAECITDYHASNNADWVMYRKALAQAAESLKWSVYWFDQREAFNDAAKILKTDNLETSFAQLRKSIGPPWNQDHKIAFSGALSAQRSV
jgi:hypothetical protein